MNCEQANQLDLVEFLNKLGYQPNKVSGNDYWYLSPLRDEINPSFKVNKQKNCWYDHGLGAGGRLVDFVIRYFNCPVNEALQQISFFQQQTKIIAPAKRASVLNDQSSLDNSPESVIRVIDFKNPIADLRLRLYLKTRRIPEDIANMYCGEVSFDLRGKIYTAIGFKNNAGGFELRNEYFKASSSPKYVSYLDNKATDIAVFEGFFDFLSYQTMHRNQRGCQPNFLVLNSLSFFQRSLLLMEKHERVSLYLDQDEAGKKCITLAQRRSLKFQDESQLYKGYKDLNDWMMNIGKGTRQRQSQGRHL